MAATSAVGSRESIKPEVALNYTLQNNLNLSYKMCIKFIISKKNLV